jgi:peptide deformylase
MILEIVQYGDPVLRKKCALVEEVTDEIRAMVDDMLETMEEAHGIGLAAPQIGRDIQLAVVDVSHDPGCVSYVRVDGEAVKLEEMMPLVFINPTLKFGSEKESMEEGCLSIHDIRAEVTRPLDVSAELTTLEGKKVTLETDGLLARAIQHEVDHLNGILFVDRVTSAAKLSLRRKLKRL